MKLSSKRALSLAVAGVLLLLAGVAAAVDIPLGNWIASPTWTPSSSAGGHMKFVDISGPIPFIPMTPCRLADTRGVAFPAATHPPTLAAGVTQNWQITGNCGVPAGASAVSANFTVTNALGTGFIGAWPQGGSFPGVSTVNYNFGQTVANAAVVPLSAGGQISVVAGSAGTDLILDVNGYYAVTPANQSNYFNVVNNSALYTIFARNNSATCGGACGMVAVVSSGIAIYGESTTGGDGVYGTNDNSSAPGVHGMLSVSVGLSSAVYGEHKATGFLGIGVQGSHAGTGWGVYGVSSGTTGIGARGGRFVANSTSDGTIGVEGVSNGATGISFGVRGENASTTAGSAGVHGVGAGVLKTYGVWGQQGATIPDMFGSSGGVGGYFTSQGTWGALGNSPTRGVQGDRVDGTTGSVATGGVLGYLGTSGVHSFQDITAAGTKSFVEPHPTDPGKQIVYIAMEGPEAGTYFRGRGRFEGKSAVIVVPESFRLVTEEEGLTVQITPIGRATAVGVTSIDLNQIVVEATRDVEFSYLVQGVRHHRGRFEAIQPNSYFVPANADARMDPWPPQIQKQLVDLGIYSSDGRVIMETAERMGWAQTWREEERLRQQAQQELKAISQAPRGSEQIPRQ